MSTDKQLVSTQSLGRVTIVPKGEYNSTTEYSPLDLVIYGGSSYLAKKTCTGKTPGNVGFWQLVALGGAGNPNIDNDGILYWPLKASDSVITAATDRVAVQRMFRFVNKANGTIPVNQCVVNTGTTLLFGGTSPDNLSQRIVETDFSGNALTNRDASFTTLGHFNDMSYYDGQIVTVDSLTGILHIIDYATLTETRSVEIDKPTQDSSVIKSEDPFRVLLSLFDLSENHRQSLPRRSRSLPRRQTPRHPRGWPGSRHCHATWRDPRGCFRQTGWRLQQSGRDGLLSGRGGRRKVRGHELLHAPADGARC